MAKTNVRSTPEVEMLEGGVSIVIPLAPEVSGKYMAMRIDTDLTGSEATVLRRIQDAMELQGKKCRGPVGALKFLLATIKEASPGKPEYPVNPNTR